jgi:hypothetical protein
LGSKEGLQSLTTQAERSASGPDPTIVAYRFKLLAIRKQQHQVMGVGFLSRYRQRQRSRQGFFMLAYLRFYQVGINRVSSIWYDP